MARQPQRSNETRLEWAYRTATRREELRFLNNLPDDVQNETTLERAWHEAEAHERAHFFDRQREREFARSYPADDRPYRDYLLLLAAGFAFGATVYFIL